MNPRFSLADSVYTVRENPDFSVIVNRIIAKRFGTAAARNRQDITETEFPARAWRGVVNGETFEIAEIMPAPGIAALAAAAAAVAAALEAVTAAQGVRDEAARAALDEGQPAALVASAAGVSLARMYQIRDRRRA